MIDMIGDYMANKKLSFVLHTLFLSAIAVLTIILLAGVSVAVPSEEWNKTFGGTGYDSAYSVQQTADGGYIITGCTSSYGDDSSDVWLIKTDVNGEEEWNKTFGGENVSIAHSVQQTSDSGYALVGFTTRSGGMDVWFIRTDANGNEQWNKTFGGDYADHGYYVQETSEGGFIIAGTTQSYGAIVNAWLIKTDANGNEEWNRTYGGETCSVQQTSDGGYILAGNTPSYGLIVNDAWLIKTDSNGNKQWNKTYKEKGIAYSVQQTSDGGYILVGFTNTYGASLGDGWLMKVDKNGNIQWNKTFGGKDYDKFYSVQQTKESGYIISGKTGSYGVDGYDAWLIKTDVNGNEQWNLTFGGIRDEGARSVQQTADGGYIIAGSIIDYETMFSDAFLVKIESEKSTPGFEIFGAISSLAIIVVISTLKRKKS